MGFPLITARSGLMTPAVITVVEAGALGCVYRHNGGRDMARRKKEARV